MRFHWLRIVCLLAIVAIVLPSGAMAGTHYFCRMAERVLSCCCCSEEAEPAATVRVAKVRAPDCCDRLVSPERSGANGVGDAALHLPGAALAKILAPYVDPAPECGLAGVAPAQARPPPSLGPPLFIVHCALLT
jgi:hypothetical protein